MLAGLASLFMMSCTRFFGTAPAPASPLPQSTPAPFPTSAELIASPTPADHTVPEGSQATASEIVNIVQLKAGLEATPEQAEEGAVLGAGWLVNTGTQSRVRLDLNESTTIRLGAETSFAIEALATDGTLPVSLVHLISGYMWVGVTEATLQTLTPIGVISMQGSYAIFKFEGGDLNNSDDDVLTVECFDGPCTVQTITETETAGRLERLILSKGGKEVTREALTDTDVQSFIAFNPETSEPLLAALLGAAPTLAEETPTQAETTPEVTEGATSTQAAIKTATPTTAAATATTRPAASATTGSGSVLGKHIVRAGESLYCIGRAYGVLPDAIAQANGITPRTTILVGRELVIPAVQWRNPGNGPTCVAQFASPYVNGATATP